MAGRESSTVGPVTVMPLDSTETPMHEKQRPAEGPSSFVVPTRHEWAPACPSGRTTVTAPDSTPTPYLCRVCRSAGTVSCHPFLAGHHLHHFILFLRAQQSVG